MQETTLGGSGLIVSRIGLGLAALGRPGYINLGHGHDMPGGRDVASMRARAHEVLDAARDAGVRYVDTARSYGRGEEFLASWLAARGVDPGELTVGSKWGYTYTAGWEVEAEAHEVKDHSAATLRRQAAESRETLGPYLNLYQIHSATRESGVLGNREVLEELTRLRDEGWKVGLSVTGPHQAETVRNALAVEVAGSRLFDCVQATWNLLEPSAGPALAEAKREGLGVIVKEALANGRLTGRDADPSSAAKQRLLGWVASRLDTSPDALALAAALAQPWADVVLSGAATLDQLRSNLEATAVIWDDDSAEALATLAEPAAEYWETRSRLPWN